MIIMLAFIPLRGSLGLVQELLLSKSLMFELPSLSVTSLMITCMVCFIFGAVSHVSWKTSFSHALLECSTVSRTTKHHRLMERVPLSMQQRFRAASSNNISAIQQNTERQTEEVKEFSHFYHCTSRNPCSLCSFAHARTQCTHTRTAAQPVFSISRHKHWQSVVCGSQTTGQ